MYLVYGTGACGNMFENIKRKNYTIFFFTSGVNTYVRG